MCATYVLNSLPRLWAIQDLANVEPGHDAEIAEVCHDDWFLLYFSALKTIYMLLNRKLGFLTKI